MIRIDDLHTNWLRDPAHWKKYGALESEFAVAAALTCACADAGLTLEQQAEQMGAKQEGVARWEGGKVLQPTRALTQHAKTTWTTLQISFVPPHDVVK